jgi:hypothetical protein
MKGSKSLLASLLVLLIFLLAACGDISPQKTEGLNKETAGELSGFAMNSQERLLAMLPGGTEMSSLASSSSRLPNQVARLLPRRGLSALSTEEDECITFTGDFTDADLDEIPVDATFTFDCAYREEGSDFTVSGNAHFQDANDEDAVSGYAIEFIDFTISETKNGQTNRLELNQTFVLGINDDKSLYVIENDLELNATTPAGSFTYSELATLGYAPDDVTDPFAAGTFALHSATTWQSGEDIYQLTGASSALHYSATCESGFDAGTVGFEDNFNNNLIITYNACDNVTVLYNGTTVSEE